MATPEALEGGKAQAAQVQPSPQPSPQLAQPQPAQQPQPQIDEAVRQQLSELLSELIVKAQELAFELATINPGEVGRCPAVKPLIEKARDLIVSLKRLFALRKTIGG